MGMPIILRWYFLSCLSMSHSLFFFGIQKSLPTNSPLHLTLSVLILPFSSPSFHQSSISFLVTLVILIYHCVLFPSSNWVPLIIVYSIYLDFFFFQKGYVLAFYFLNVFPIVKHFQLFAFTLSF